MGRFWLGVGLLVLFLVLGLWVSTAMGSTHQTIANTLEAAADAALRGNPEAAFDLAKQAQDMWQSRRHAVATIADHAPMDEIDGLFSQLKVYGQFAREAELAAHCARIAKLICAIGDAHALNWWNLL